MKKFFTLIAAVAIAASASAQATANVVKWAATTTGEVADVVTTPKVSGSDVTASAITLGTGMNALSAVQKTHKVNGSNVNYEPIPVKFSPSNKQVSKEQSDGSTKSVTDDPYLTIEGAVQYDQIVKFPFEAATATGYTNLKTVTMKVARTGTDDVRVNVRVTGEADSGDFDSNWLITADNVASIQGEGAAGRWFAAEDGKKVGYQPTREDDSKDYSNSLGYDNLKFDLSSVIANNDLFKGQIEVAVFGISDNKAALIFDVEATFSDAATAVAGVAEAKAEAKAPVKVITANGVQIGNFNIAGQQVK